MIRFKFSKYMVDAAIESYNRAVMRHPKAAVSHLKMLPCGGREYTINLP